MAVAPIASRLLRASKNLRLTVRNLKIFKFKMDLNEERHNAGGVIIQKPRFLNGQRGHVPTATRDHGTVDPSLCRESGRRRTFEKG